MDRTNGNIDDVDMRILKLLKEDSRLSYRSIAKTLNLSTGTISQRIRKLVETGVIRRFTADIDPAMVGKKCTVLVMLRSKPGAKLEEIIKRIEALDESCCIHTITGDFNLHVMLRLKDQGSAADFLEELRNMDGVAFVTSFVVLRSYKHLYESSI